jgi:type IX secretion system PorP/SprF family membrane protein
MRILILFCFIATSLFVTKISAQDIHASHIHAAPLLYNPAMTGIYNADVRLIANFRSQWGSIGTDYRTCYASAEMKTRQLAGSSALGFGLEVFSDSAGDLDYSQKGVQLSISGIKMLDRHSRKLFSGGIKAGYVMDSFDPTKIIAFDEEVSITKGDAFSRTSYFDLSAGLAWAHMLDSEKHSYYLGISASHVNTPEISFDLAESNAVGNELYRKFVIHGGGDFSLTRKISIQPSFIFMDQGPSREVTIGSFIGYSSKDRYTKRGKADNKFSLQIGGWLRGYVDGDNVKGMDAVVLAAKANINQTSITFSFDMNISSLAIATSGRGGPEISIIQLLSPKKVTNQRIKCPAFY